MSDQKPLAEKLREILLPDDVEIDENAYSDPWSYSLACDQFEREKAISEAMIEAVAALEKIIEPHLFSDGRPMYDNLALDQVNMIAGKALNKLKELCDVPV